MPSLKRGIKYLFTNRAQFIDSIVKNYFGFLPDKIYLSLRYRCQMGRWINWKNPQTFTEKLQWLKVYNHRLEYTTMVDKVAVKKYVADLIGEEYIIPTLGVWDNPEDIDWDTLPNQFVLKTTHSGGSNGVIICRDKRTFDTGEAVSKLNESLKSDIYSTFREWPYKDVPRRVIAEQLICEQHNQGQQDLTDYKFFCFNGEPEYCQVIRNRSQTMTIDFYDMEWKHQEFIGLHPVMTNGLHPVTCPIHINDLRTICMKLAKDIPFVRIDFYVLDNREYFGELTFYPASGFGVFTPYDWDIKLGELLLLGNKK